MPRPEIAAILSAPLPETAKNGDGVQHGPARPPQPPGRPATPAGSHSAPDDGTGTVTGARPGPGAGGKEGAGEDESPAARGAHGTSAQRTEGAGVPTPKDLAGLGRPGPGVGATAGPPGATLRWSSDRGWVERAATGEAPETASLPMLAQLTTAEQRWADREEDITAVSGDPFEVGQVFARRWIERLTTGGHLGQLSGEYPRIPHRIDGELLRYAARFGLLAHKDDQIDEHDRYAIRAGFWREVDARTGSSAEHAPAGD